MDFIIQNFNEFLTFTGFANASAGNLIMILVGALFIWLAIKKILSRCFWFLSDWESFLATFHSVPMQDSK